MRRFSHFLAIDWSGARGERHKGIALSLADADGGPPVLVEPPPRGWARTDVLTLLRDVSMAPGFGTEKKTGSQNMTVIMSVVETCRRLGTHPLDYLQQAIQANFNQHPPPKLIPNT